MELIPAIDIIDGNCVRLTQGDYGKKTVYNDDPVAVAREFERMGFKRLHVVDLDGAKSHHIVNATALGAITAATSLVVDFGGGLKTNDDVDTAFAAGAQFVTVGSVAVSNPAMLEGWIEKFGAERIVLGADVRNGKVAINGWLDDSGVELMPFLARYIEKGVSNVLCTDISRDGMLSGPALDMYREIMAAFPSLHLIASGGVSGNSDIEALHNAGIPAVVFGKAFYEGLIDVEALKTKGIWDSRKE